MAETTTKAAEILATIKQAQQIRLDRIAELYAEIAADKAELKELGAEPDRKPGRPRGSKSARKAAEKTEATNGAV